MPSKNNLDHLIQEISGLEEMLTTEELRRDLRRGLSAALYEGGPTSDGWRWTEEELAACGDCPECYGNSRWFHWIRYFFERGDEIDSSRRATVFLRKVELEKARDETLEKFRENGIELD